MNFGPVISFCPVMGFGPLADFGSVMNFGPVPDFELVTEFGPVTEFGLVMDFGPAFFVPNFSYLAAVLSLARYFSTLNLVISRLCGMPRYYRPVFCLGSRQSGCYCR